MENYKEIAEDIINSKLPEQTLKDVYNVFFELMRKHGIKQGTVEGNGVICDNYEWTLFKTLFLKEFESQFEMGLFFDGVPKDLHH